MKAALYKKYGSPDVVQIGAIPKPVAGENEMIIRVYATTVNRTDAGFRSAEYFISRFWSGLLRPKNPVLGCEFAGIVESAGSHVTEYAPGDRVFGYNDENFGGNAEYILAKQTDAIVKIPEGISFETAACISEGAHYALGNIRAANVQEGDNVLVYGATGAIGSAAVQLLKYFGAKVTAVCGTPHVDLMKKLGADDAVDYKTRDFTDTPRRYKLVFDAVGKSSFGQTKKLLLPNGVYISTELGKNGENVWRAIWGKITGGRRILFPIPVTAKSDIQFLADRVADGSFRPLIDRVYPLDEIREAHRYVSSGQKVGNVVIRVRE